MLFLVIRWLAGDVIVRPIRGYAKVSEEEIWLVALRRSESVIQFSPNLLKRIIVGQHMAEAEVKKIGKIGDILPIS